MIKNLLVLVVSLGILVALLEGVVFRWLLLPSDLPLLQETTPEKAVLKYISNQTGTYRKRDEISAQYSINSNGWNSGRQEYLHPEGVDRRSICIIGDSYIEAFQVRFDQSVAERLEGKLKEAGQKVPVFRFGLSGAPLSQYLFILENEVLTYQPEVVIINLVHNDFHESVQGTGGSYDRGFSRFAYDQDHKMSITQPAVYERDAIWWIKTSALFRYFRVRQEVDFTRARKALVAFFDKGKADREREVSANISLQRGTLDIVEDVTRFAFSRIKALSTEHKFRPIFLVDGDRSEIMSSVNSGLPSRVKTKEINELVVKIANDLSLEVIDLWPILERDYREKRERLTFEHDGHWPPHVHDLVANTLAAVLIDN